MSLIRLRDICLSFGGPALLDHLNLTLEPNERVCLVGRNGSGKSTLLQVLNGEIKADDGKIERNGAVKLARLQQDVPQNFSGSVFDLVALGLGEAAPLLQRYEALLEQIAESSSDELLKELEILQKELENCGGWALEQQVKQVLSRLNLDGSLRFESLSGGLKRRVLLAQALVNEPDILLLDEPTNHLDIEAIQWLENFLSNFPGCLLFISHDRAFIRALATRVIDLDRGQLSSWSGDYDNYLLHKQEALDAEEKQQALFDKKLAQEEAWIRQGIKARRTRNEGRVRQLQALRKERGERRERIGSARFDISTAEKSGQKVIEVQNLSYSVGERPLIKDFSTLILRQDRIGIIGPNGVGKSTLLKLLLGELKPDQGEVKLGTHLNIAYFDQLRSQLDLTRSVRDNLGQGKDTVSINGREKHVIGYLQDFLFSPARANTPVSALSGGEKNRLMLAKLFARESNLLVLDEPTNDLDIETLDLLEDLIAEYPGTLLIVSHDRSFLNNVVTSTLVFEGEGQLKEYVGGYDDWLRQRPASTPTFTPKENKTTEKPAPTPNKTIASGKKALSFKEQRELDNLPDHMQALEDKIAQLQNELANPILYQQEPDKSRALSDALQENEEQLSVLFARWEALENKKNALS